MESPPIVTALAKAFSFSAPKWLTAGLIATAEYVFGPPVLATTALSLFGLVILDMVMGVSASWYAGEQIASRKLARTVSKLLAYFGATVAVATVARAVPVLAGFHEPLVTLTLSLALLAETLSILEKAAKLGFSRARWIAKFLRRKLREIETEEPEVSSTESSD